MFLKWFSFFQAFLEPLLLHLVDPCHIEPEITQLYIIAVIHLLTLRPRSYLSVNLQIFAHFNKNQAAFFDENIYE